MSYLQSLFFVFFTQLCSSVHAKAAKAHDKGFKLWESAFFDECVIDDFIFECFHRASDLQLHGHQQDIDTLAALRILGFGSPCSRQVTEVNLVKFQYETHQGTKNNCNDHLISIGLQEGLKSLHPRSFLSDTVQ